ncbi:manganese efflux pump [Cohnella nanjingensis]|uniref:Manganese efflux pump n=1 Tax=Cohnella nanjingensis TaxID=1387779 RepID=A0A7X0RMW6_9BACL|nr:manganese efflux pump [Cohnella nanjingensis]MBB6670427.1 manganese efflux pump [Cohnella nanjingensis]
MHWLSIVLIGVAANIDNLGIGVTFGARKTRVPLLSNLLIAFLSMAATYVAMTAGMYFSELFPLYWGNLIGGGVLVLLGVWGIRKVVRERRKAAASGEGAGSAQASERIADRTDKDGDHVISWVESISLGFALSVNCIGSSFGAGASGVSPWITALSVGVFSFASVDIGVRLGSKIAKSWLGRYSELLGCILLMAIGCYEMIF